MNYPNKDNAALGASLPPNAVPLNRDFTFVMRKDGDRLHHTEDGCHWGVQIGAANRRYLNHYPSEYFKPCHVCFPYGLPPSIRSESQAG